MAQKTLDKIAAVNRQYETLAEAAARLGVHPKTLRRRIACGQLPAYRIGTHIRLIPTDVDQAVLRPIVTLGRSA